MRSTFDGVDVVDIRLNVLGELGAVLQRDVIFDPLAGASEVDHFAVQRIAGAVEVFDEFDDTAFVLEVAAFAVAFVKELDVHAGVEECEFLQPLVDGVKVVLGDREDLRVSFEGRLGTSLFRGTTLFDRSHRNATFVALVPVKPSRLTSTSAHCDKKLTTVTPTPCKPPLVLIGALLELATELETVITPSSVLTSRSISSDNCL